MKLLLVTTNYGGGAGIACRRQHRALLESGIDSKLLILYKTDAPTEKNVFSVEEILTQKKGKLYFKLLKYLNLFLNKLPVFFNTNVFINGPFSIFRIDQLDIYKQSDIVHFHWVPKMISWKHVFANKDKHFFWTLHDMNPFTGGNHYAQDYDYSKFKHLLNKNVSKKASYVKGCNLKIICPSVWLTDLAKQSEVFKKFEAFTVPNCVDTEIFKPLAKAKQKESLQLPPNKKVMLFVAENPNDKRKGMHLLLQSLKELKHTDNICLLVIGKQIKIESAIEIIQLGVIKSESALATIYNAADFFVIPSLEDNLPNTIVESMACGTPVIGFKTGGLPDLIINNETGMLVSFEDEVDLARCIDLFISMPDASVYSKGARELAVKKCSEKEVVKRLVELYELS